MLEGTRMASLRDPTPNASILNGVSVLVVEDAWFVAKAVKSALEQAGMHVVGPTATTADARRLVAMEVPKLALIDVNLKHEMACELIDDLHGRGVHVIVASGYAAPPIAKDKIAACLQKPFSGAELIRTISTIVDRLA
jgi:DNA-binding NtrC family response regulator